MESEVEILIVATDEPFLVFDCVDGSQKFQGLWSILSDMIVIHPNLMQVSDEYHAQRSANT